MRQWAFLLRHSSVVFEGAALEHPCPKNTMKDSHARWLLATLGRPRSRLALYPGCFLPRVSCESEEDKTPSAMLATERRMRSNPRGEWFRKPPPVYRGALTSPHSMARPPVASSRGSRDVRLAFHGASLGCCRRVSVRARLCLLLCSPCTRLSVTARAFSSWPAARCRGGTPGTRHPPRLVLMLAADTAGPHLLPCVCALRSAAPRVLHRRTPRSFEVRERRRS